MCQFNVASSEKDAWSPAAGKVAARSAALAGRQSCPKADRPAPQKRGPKLWPAGIGVDAAIELSGQTFDSRRIALVRAAPSQELIDFGFQTDSFRPLQVAQHSQVP
jgi:hypothetical protein